MAAGNFTMAFMAGHSWIGWIIFGAIAGFIAKGIMGDRAGLIITILLGIVGAYVGGFLANNVLGMGVGSSWLGSLVVAVIGAAVVLAIYNFVAARRTI